MAMTQKDFNLAMFLAITALATRLTGEKLVITVSGEDGDSHSISGDDRFETWLRTGDEYKVPFEVGEAARQMPPEAFYQAPGAEK